MSIIRISEEIHSPLSLVWKSWTLPDHIVNWNYASDSWHCPKAENKLQPDGRFSFRMEAKDGCMGFDFSGKYLDIKEGESISSVLDDGRNVHVKFEQKKEYVIVSQEFEAEKDNSEELQKKGWQAILENFKSYTESLAAIVRMNFEILIKAPVEKVYETMLAEDTYKQWTYAFYPGSFYRGSWDEGEKILFIARDSEGNEGGMVARVKKSIPNEVVSLEHYGILDKGEEITEGPEISIWAGALEEYRFEPVAGGTLLKIISDTNREYQEYFENTWPKALESLKSICEN
ncbi:SRPBCC family protein [Indibacter alkaliphilus]|uniref:SRPBCC family protein n=1 Tax=Indibacter alkaliphilus TaxID=579922 RepID=UPI00028239D9|nr:SRPBCC family protein [Indibacter alkaliphilus]